MTLTNKEDDQKMIDLEAVRENGLGLKYVKNQTPEICLEAVKNHGWALQYVKNQTDEICLEAVKKNGWALQYVRAKNRTDKICLEAVKCDGRALKFIKEVNEEMALASLFHESLHYSIERQELYRIIQKNTEEMSRTQYALNQLFSKDLPIHSVSYQLIRRLLATGMLSRKQSPYHVLEQLSRHR